MPEPWFESATVDALCEKIQDLLVPLAEKYKEDEYGDEDDLSSQFAARIEVAVENHELKYLPSLTYMPGPGGGTYMNDEARLHAVQVPPNKKPRLVGRRLTFRGRNQEEPAFGADLLFMFETRNDYFSKKKGLLIQCKDSYHKKFRPATRPRLKLQCVRMHAVTDHSYVMFFTDEGFKFARNPIAPEKLDFGLEETDYISLRDVFHSFFECTGGDEKIKTARRGDFFTIANDIVAKRTLVITAQDPAQEGVPVGEE